MRLSTSVPSSQRVLLLLPLVSSALREPRNPNPSEILCTLLIQSLFWNHHFLQCRQTIYSPCQGGVPYVTITHTAHLHSFLEFFVLLLPTTQVCAVSLSFVMSHSNVASSLKALTTPEIDHEWREEECETDHRGFRYQSVMEKGVGYGRGSTAHLEHEGA